MTKRDCGRANQYTTSVIQFKILKGMMKCGFNLILHLNLKINFIGAIFKDTLPLTSNPRFLHLTST